MEFDFFLLRRRGTGLSSRTVTVVRTLRAMPAVSQGQPEAHKVTVVSR